MTLEEAKDQLLKNKQARLHLKAAERTARMSQNGHDALKLAIYRIEESIANIEVWIEFHRRREVAP